MTENEIKAKKFLNWINENYNKQKQKLMSFCNDKNYEWDEDVLKSQGIDTKNLAQGDTIIVQYNLINETVDVASTKGFSNSGIAIHALKDF